MHIKHLFAIFFFLLIQLSAFTQTESDSTLKADNKIYLITKTDGSQFIGKIISQDSREVLLETKTLGQIYIPKHVIKEIKEIDEKNISSKGNYSTSETFSTRYFFTTNGLPINQGESYLKINLSGPEYHYGIAKNLGIGIITTWFATPVIGTVKYTFKLNDGIYMGLGTLLGTGSWVFPEFAFALPYSSVTFGDRGFNFTFSGGYGYLQYREGGGNFLGGYDPYNRKVAQGRFLFSVAGMKKVSKNLTVLFDSVIMPEGPEYQQTYIDWVENPDGSFTEVQRTRMVKSPAFALLTPGLRWELNPENAFQFGFNGIYFDSTVFPLPLPSIQWFRKI
jgi:hypothetical protein